MKTVHLYPEKGQKPKLVLRKLLGYKGKHVGKGVFARVYWCTKLRRIIKVGKLTDPYLEYVKLIRKETSSLVPRIDKVIYCHDFEEDHVASWKSLSAYAIIMERLYHARTPRQKAIRDLMVNSIDPEDCVLLESIVEANPRPAFLRDLLKLNKRITKKADRSRWDGDCALDLDVHSDNIMFRANGQPVITDPYC